MSILSNPYRNVSLIQMETYETDNKRADQLIGLVRDKWSLLREKGLAGDAPIEILRSGVREGNGNGNGSGTGHAETKVKVVEIFRWNSQQSRRDARALTDYSDISNRISSLVTTGAIQETYSEVVRGFNVNFPSIGGVELLRGVCSCMLTIDGIVENYPMSVKNGIVLMHRSPRMDIDGDGRYEMYLDILMHGGEIVQAALGPIRVEQNFSKPNDGIVKSNGVGEFDFPATAIWRVSWRIRTALGPVLTDPDQPLIFGPATVEHYPPVGTHFHSSTGPVKLVLEETGEQVGTLTPGELTAFEIVVTKDDEIFADHLNDAPPEVLDLVQEYAKQMNKSAAREMAEAATN